LLNLDAAEWRILGERMKTREHHVVLLSRQSVELLRELQAISRRSEFLFPAVGNPRRPMSENTVNAALRRLGYAHDEMNGRGFRSEASMLLNEQGWHPDLIELQLAHAERNNVRAAYDRAQRLVERRRTMQSWADYLQRLQDGKGAGEAVRVEAA
jgi:integrase